MNIKFHTSEPKDIKFTMELTMPLSEWLELREQLDTKWPSASLSGEITDMILQAQKTFYPKYE